ncbi:hypothetical protein ACDQ55_01725 [Chitinophaga sp. 30R24]|uniref:hypothetical protein n=1 Tax=Chitinophaga sp. 30R24 TaxID=3248838 RepID=UPI003B8FAB32
MKSYFSTNRVLAWTIASVAVVSVFFACKKDVTKDDVVNNLPDNSAFAAAQHQTVVSSMYADLYETVSTEAVSQGLDKAARVGNVPNDLAKDPVSCPSTELLDATDNKWPKRVVIDFGTSCLDRFGVYRSGVLNVTFSGPLFNAASTVTVEPSNFKRNGIPVEGKYIITNATWSATAGVAYTAEVVNGKVKLADTLVVNYISKRTVKQTAGGETPANAADDVYSVTGTETLSYEKGGLIPDVTASFETQTPIVKQWICPRPSQGKLKVTVNRITGVIDYGNGKCDDPITITIGGKAKQLNP